MISLSTNARSLITVRAATPVGGKMLSAIITDSLQCQQRSIACYRCNRICRRWALVPGGLLSGGSYARGDFWPVGLLAGGIFVWGSLARGIFVRGAYARSPNFNAYTYRLGFLCLAWSMFTLLVAVYSWPSRSVTDMQPKNDKLGPVYPRAVDPRSPNFQGM